jgi:hypothetical protein
MGMGNKQWVFYLGIGNLLGFHGSLRGFEPSGRASH